ncbi:hypothetical protein BU16DRAFT_282051 [Lophium mytilinum]|uniref:Uncharacterized protein n=1 Tax=Lophium mytilinum TaxID=390894 RepID=A0A6A6R4R6_9PEZI|nr:hypothetical protein BU16DRAFT_282051 [Lophium mytilinum]
MAKRADRTAWVADGWAASLVECTMEREVESMGGVPPRLSRTKDLPRPPKHHAPRNNMHTASISSTHPVHQRAAVRNPRHIVLCVRQLPRSLCIPAQPHRCGEEPNDVLYAFERCAITTNIYWNPCHLGRSHLRDAILGLSRELTLALTRR